MQARDLRQPMTPREKRALERAISPSLGFPEDMSAALDKAISAAADAVEPTRRRRKAERTEGGAHEPG